MPNESLPKLGEKLKNLLQRHPQQKEQQEAPDETKNLSPNLLAPVSSDDLLSKARPQIVKFTNYAVFSIGGLFFLLILANFYFDFSLNKSKTLRDQLIDEIDTSSHVTDAARDVTNLTNIYKQNKTASPKIGKPLKEIFEIVTSTVRLEALSYRREQNKYSLTAKSYSAVQYANLIRNLLEIEGVKDITIKNVELKASGVKEYVAVLEVNLE